jgi:hypothetical protein
MAMQEDKGPWGDFFARWPKEGFDMMSKGLDMYGKMTKAWMEAAETSAKDKPEDIMKKWSDSFGGIYKDLFEMFTQPMKMYGFSPSFDKAPWDETFRTWQQSFSSMPVGAVPSFQGIDEFVKFSRGWQDSYAKVYSAWLSNLEKMAEAYRSGGAKGEEPEKVMKACMDSTETFIDEWSNFVAGQTRAYFQLWKSLFGKEKAAPKKGGAKVKE